MLAVAPRGLPRDSYRLMTKMRLREAEDLNATFSLDGVAGSLKRRSPRG